MNQFRAYKLVNWLFYTFKVHTLRLEYLYYITYMSTTKCLYATTHWLDYWRIAETKPEFLCTYNVVVVSYGKVKLL